MAHGFSIGRGAGVALIVLGLGTAAGFLLFERDLPQPQPPALVPLSEDPGAPPVRDDTPTDDTVAAVDANAPTLDVVRVDANGATVVAGRGAPDTDVVLRVDGRTVITARTDSAGDFVSLFDIAKSTDPSLLTLESVDAQGNVARAKEEIILAPVDPGTATPISDTETANATAKPPRLFRSGSDGVTRVAADTSSDGTDTTLGIDAISYDGDGQPQLTGQGAKDSRLRIYLDGQPVREARVDPTGAWVSPLPAVETGVYTLRVDALAEDGSVTGRVETPFQRVDPDVAVAQGESVRAVTVQPGATLWAISEGHFGEGIRYVQIFEANRSQIRNADLIYPGQIFTLPDG
ncbi:LysM peptidoglycan-binding domain-containing protein [Jannaschia rubra]|uniref:LysM peptidoglycan-binding domain-containing protein n=1 Tax=Jannaschia rubra TaxID=282197 RepID=UPI0024922B50|nr:LysM peptidoglycan-binding domain-containing protein [Jannaschia rubra]